MSGGREGESCGCLGKLWVSGGREGESCGCLEVERGKAVGVWASCGCLEVEEASCGCLEVEEASCGCLEVEEASCGCLEVEDNNCDVLSRSFLVPLPVPAFLLSQVLYTAHLHAAFMQSRSEFCPELHLVMENHGCDLIVP